MSTKMTTQQFFQYNVQAKVCSSPKMAIIITASMLHINTKTLKTKTNKKYLKSLKKNKK